MVLIYHGLLFSHKSNEILPFATICMDLEVIILNKVSQTEKQISCNITYMWNLKKNDTNEVT